MIRFYQHIDKKSAIYYNIDGTGRAGSHQRGALPAGLTTFKPVPTPKRANERSKRK